MADIIKSIHIFDENDKKHESEISFTVRWDGSILLQEEPLDINNPYGIYFAISHDDAKALVNFLLKELKEVEDGE